MSPSLPHGPDADLAALLRSTVSYALITTDLDRMVVQWSEGARRALGWTEAEMRGVSADEIFTPEDREAGAPEQEMQAALSSGCARDDRWHLRKDGSRFWANGELTPLRDSRGAAVGFLKILRDRSDALRIEQALEDANRRLSAEGDRLRSFFEQAPSFMALLRGPEHVFELANAAYLRLIGRADIIGKPVREALPDIEGQGFFELLDGVFESGRPFVGHDLVVSLQREADEPLEERRLDFLYQPVLDSAGRVSGIFVEGSDVTERWLAASALAASEERLRIAQRAGGIGAFEWDPEQRTLTVSPEFRNLYGIAPDAEVTFDSVAALVDPGDLARIEAGRTGLGPTSLDYTEYRIARADDGQVRWIARKGEVVAGPDGRPRGLGVAYDITQRKSAEEALRRLNATLEEQVAERTRERDRMWRLSTDLMLVARFDRTIVAVNPAWTATLGWSAQELIGRSTETLIHPDDLAGAKAMVTKLAAGVATQKFETRFRHKYGDYRWISWTAVPDENFVHGVGRDMTAEREAAEALHRTEEALRQSQKMEAVGQLTGGIAHDFNNLLTGIIGSLELMRRRIDAGRAGEIDRFLTAAVTSANRAAALVHRLLAFSRRQSLDPRPVDVNRLVASMEEMLRRTLGESVSLETALSPAAGQARTDENQLEAAVLNLAINARDAMPAGGRLSIETDGLSLGRSDPRREDLEPGDYVVLRVRDTGVGMPAEIVARAFDPFFTTKPIGQGTGLGLSMVYGFARQSGGAARLLSAPGAGTTVELYLPVDTSPPDAPADPAAPGTPRAQDGETVLVVEDEPAVRMLVCEILDELGYRGREATDADEALAILDAPGRIDLLVTDVGLPGLNGRQLAEIARRRRPELKILFITGYAESAAIRGGFLEAGMDMVAKPFAIEALAAKIREMIEQETR